MGGIRNGERICIQKGSVVVETNKGKVRGYAYNGVSVFKGIPYAKAKRFHAPEPLEAWEGELDATSFGYVSAS